MARTLAVGYLALLSVLAAAPAAAQSAADKATARRLATEGIELHGQGKYAEALERLQRAEALYDAPVHLLYIARSQAKLNQLVEASETYRRLIRVQLEPGAPAAFRDAVEAAKREVGDVEAKVGSLRVDVEPATVPGLELTIDGQKVSAAVVGVERPANPGRHVVIASAPGYRAAEDSVELGEAEKKTMRLTLVVDPTAAPPADGGGAATGAAGSAGPVPGATASDAPPEAAANKPDPDAIHILLGLRVGGAVPSGSVFQLPGAGEVSFSEYSTPGVGVEISAGAWFLRYFGAKLHLEGFGFGPGETLDRINELPFQATVTNQTSGQGAGLSIMGGTPLHQFGAFGELGFTFVHRFSVAREFEAESGGPCGEAFEQTLTFSGAAFRVGGGMRVPVARFLELNPFVMASFGQFSKLENDTGCSELDDSLGAAAIPLAGDLADDQKASHQLFFIGLGGDFLIGMP